MASAKGASGAASCTGSTSTPAGCCCWPPRQPPGSACERRFATTGSRRSTAPWFRARYPLATKVASRWIWPWCVIGPRACAWSTTPGRARPAPIAVRQTIRVLERFAAATLLEVRLETGFLHQIRVTLAHLGHPVLGDALYGDEGALSFGAGRQMLHAARVRFEEIEAESPGPRGLSRRPGRGAGAMSATRSLPRTRRGCWWWWPPRRDARPHGRSLRGGRARGAGRGGRDARRRGAAGATSSRLDALVLGSGVHMGGMESSMRVFFERCAPLWMQGALVGKVGAAFVARVRAREAEPSSPC